MIVINIDELKGIMDILISKLKNENVSELIINDDLYRYIPTESWASFSNPEIDTGSLSDDIENLKLLLNNKERPCTYVDFDRLASLLRAISQNRNPI